MDLAGDDQGAKLCLQNFVQRSAAGIRNREKKYDVKTELQDKAAHTAVGLYEDHAGKAYHGDGCMRLSASAGCVHWADYGISADGAYGG